MSENQSSFFRSFFYILILFIISFNLTKAESEIKKLPGKRFNTQEEINDYLKKTDLTVLAFFYRPESDKSNSVAESLKIVYSKLQYLIEYILINCDESSMEECRQSDDEMEDEFFKIEVYMPPEYRYNPYTKELNKHQKLMYTKNSITDKALYNFLTKTIISREQILTNENFDNFKSRNDLNKVILFTNKKNSPLMYRGLSGYFFDRLALGLVFDSEKKLCEKLNINKFPTLLVIQTFEDDVILDDPVEKIYDGKMDTESIVNFLEKYALKEKLYLSKDKNKKNKGANKNLIYFNKLTAEKTMNFIKTKKDKEVIFYFDNKVENGKITYDNLPEDIKDFNADTHGFFHFGYVDCTGEENEKICKNNFKIKEFPNMVLYRPEKDVKEKIAKGNELPMEMSDLRREINILFEPNVKSASPSDFNYFIAESIQNKRLSLIYLFDGFINLGFSLITQNKVYSNIFDFIVMDNPPDEIKQQFQCNSLPYISIIVPDETRKDKNGNPEMQVMVYRGKFSYSEINSFMKNSFDFQEKEDSAQSSPIDDDKPVEITFIQKTKDLETTCTKKKLCIIAFFDMRPGEDFENNFEKNFDIFRNFTEISRKRPTSFGYINATCQEEFSSKFGINTESLPSIIIYSYTKDAYANLVGGFNEEDMTELINKAVSGRINFQRMQKDNAILQDIKCETIQPYVESDDDDDDIMKELLAEERRKREEFDKERNAEDDSKKKKKKKKKDKKEKKDKKKKKDKTSDL